MLIVSQGVLDFCFGNLAQRTDDHFSELNIGIKIVEVEASRWITLIDLNLLPGRRSVPAFSVRGRSQTPVCGQQSSEPCALLDSGACKAAGEGVFGQGWPPRRRSQRGPTPGVAAVSVSSSPRSGEMENSVTVGGKSPRRGLRDSLAGGEPEHHAASGREIGFSHRNGFIVTNLERYSAPPSARQNGTTPRPWLRYPVDLAVVGNHNAACLRLTSRAGGKDSACDSSSTLF